LELLNFFFELSLANFELVFGFCKELEMSFTFVIESTHFLSKLSNFFLIFSCTLIVFTFLDVKFELEAAVGKNKPVLCEVVYPIELCLGNCISHLSLIICESDFFCELTVFSLISVMDHHHFGVDKLRRSLPREDLHELLPLNAKT